MDKILIITLYGDYNFGNKLQNYALLITLKKLKFYPETAIVRYRNSNVLKNVKIIIGDAIKQLFEGKKKYFRRKLFKDFNKTYIIYKKRRVNTNYIRKKKIKKYSYLVYGSDQIWNPSCFGDSDLFLGYMGDNITNIAYSASFGVSSLPKHLIKKYSNGLLNFKYISVREDDGEKIVKEYTKRKDVKVLVDPTMLLTTNEWDVLSKKPDKLKTNKYILNYFLGNLSGEGKSEIERIALENNCEIINLMDKRDKLYVSGPSEFLYLEKNAFLICTDSFHSCVFAILFNRPFIVFERKQEGLENMNSRIDTLLNKFKLKNRKFEGKITKENLDHNYSEAYKILEVERKKSDKFLRKALNIN